MGTAQQQAACLACGRTHNDTPLIVLEYRGEQLRICPQHLPVLIHQPQELVGKLPGAENLRPADYQKW